MALLAPVGIVVPGGSALLTLEAYEEDGRLCCGIYQLRGWIRLPPRRWLKAVRAEVRKLERIARAAGCVEMRLGGRDWSRILPDYQPLAGVKNGLRKVL